MSDETPDPAQEIAEALAEADGAFHGGLRVNLKSAANADPENPTPDMLKERERRELDHQNEVSKRREAKLRLDRKVRAERWMNKIPNEWRDATVETLPTELRHLCEEWLSTPDDQKTCFILTGPTGVGKTFAAYAIARELYLDRYEFLLRKASALLDEMLPKVDKHDRVFDQAKTCRYLILDDLGTEKRSTWADGRFNDIFDHRWQWKLPILITTNVPFLGLPSFLGERVTSRLLHNATVYEVKGEDRRLT